MATMHTVPMQRSSTPVGIVLPITEETLELESISLSGFAEEAPAASHEPHAVLLMPPAESTTSLTTALWDAGVLVTSFCSPHEAEPTLRSEPVDAVLMDVALGYPLIAQVTRWLHESGLGRVKLIVVGVEDPRMQEWLRTCGVAHAVARPVDVAGFAQALSAALTIR